MNVSTGPRSRLATVPAHARPAGPGHGWAAAVGGEGSGGDRQEPGPADPHLYDLFSQLPLMDTTRARRELGWQPHRSSTEAIDEMLRGMAAGAGGPTVPLAPDAPGRRLREALTGAGQRP